MTAHDPLAPFRAPGANPVPLPIPAQQGYRAFSVAAGPSKPTRLDVRPKNGLAVARLYGGILEIAYDRQDYSGILLVLPGKLVKIRGKRLRPLVEALLAGTCEWVAELEEGEAHEDGIAVVERIEIMTPQDGPTSSSHKASAGR